MEALIFIKTNWWTFSSFWPRYIQLLFLTSHWKPNAVSLSCPLAMSFVIWINNITLADFQLRINELLVLLQDAHTFVNIEPLSLYPFSVRYFNGNFYLYSIFWNTWLRIWIKGEFLCWLLICGIMGEVTAFRKYAVGGIEYSFIYFHKLWKYNKHEESTWLYGRKGLGMRIRSFNDKSDFKILKHQWRVWGHFTLIYWKKDIGFLFLSLISRIESKRRAFILVHNALLSYFIFL